MTDLAREFRALAECLRLVAGGIERPAAAIAASPAAAAPASPARQPPPRGVAGDRRRRWDDAVVAEVLRRKAASEKPKAIAAAMGLGWRQVANLVYRRPERLDLAAPAAQPGAPPPPDPRPPAARRVALTAAEQAIRQQWAAELTAPADSEAIRSWGRANGVDLPPTGALGAAAVAAVNAARAREKLPPFALVRHPIGALPAAELDAIRETPVPEAKHFTAGPPAARE